MLELEKGFARFESNPRGSRDPQASEPRLPADCMIGANNSGKVSRYIRHDYRDDCVCPSCRGARIREQRSMQPLSIREKVWIYGVLGCVGGILVLFALAKLAEWAAELAK